MAKSPNKSKDSIAKQKKLIAAVNKLLKEHELDDLKVAELRLEPRTLRGVSSSCASLQCEKNEKKIQIRRPNGTIDCICVPK